MFDGKFRQSVDVGMAPVGRWLVRIGFTADVLTFSGLVFALATAWMIAIGQFWWAILLLTLTGFHDLLDGAVAKASERASQRGNFFDSVTDRVGDALLMGGVAYYLTAHHRGQLVLLPLAILTMTFLISYERSKAESLGLVAKGGLMERAERMILLGVGLVSTAVFVPVLWIMLGLTAMTAAGRFWRVWQVAARPAPLARIDPARVDSTVGACAEGLSRALAPLTVAARSRARPLQDGRRLIEVLPERFDVALASSLAATVLRRNSASNANLERNLARVLSPAGETVDGNLLDEFVERGFRSYGQYWAEGAKLPAIKPARPSTSASSSPRVSSISTPPRRTVAASSSRCRTSARGSGAGRTWTRSAWP